MKASIEMKLSFDADAAEKAMLAYAERHGFHKGHVSAFSQMLRVGVAAGCKVEEAPSPTYEENLERAKGAIRETIEKAVSRETVPSAVEGRDPYHLSDTFLEMWRRYQQPIAYRSQRDQCAFFFEHGVSIGARLGDEVRQQHEREIERTERTAFEHGYQKCAEDRFPAGTLNKATGEAYARGVAAGKAEFEVSPYAEVIEHLRAGGVVRCLTHDEAVASANAFRAELDAGKSPRGESKPDHGPQWVLFDDRRPPLVNNGRGDTGHKAVIVTNNINARDAFGDKSHVWYGMPQYSEKDGWHVDTEGVWRSKFLTHWLDLFPNDAEWEPQRDEPPFKVVSVGVDDQGKISLMIEQKGYRK